ncbi:DUF3247 family protein [Dyella japonica]|uniref:DUF3247 domain-containing protein n=1 Tax=Dyella japonica A8 TaxID=1217721 RepID=A0A075JYR4_9GAMM|nr:DUF3247 family protein [Dyella japonica]AIF46735.1 hypothetical protein HY57_05405 [Dyella japonica A8]
MGQFAERVYTDPAMIQRLEDLIEQLPTGGHVVLQLADGTCCEGVVCESPSVQVFRDPQENEGINGVLRLERPDEPAWTRYVWLGDIQSVEQLDSITGSEA